MQFLSGNPAVLRQDMIRCVGRFRNQVFVQRLGWNLHIEDGQERDQFDREDTVYVVARDDGGSIAGAARLLPTTQPYLLGEVFAELLHGAAPPQSDHVWELSRFAVADLARPATRTFSQFSSPVAKGLLRAALDCAGRHGARRLITVSPPGVERLLLRAGFQVSRVAPPAVVNGNPLIAFWIEV